MGLNSGQNSVVAPPRHFESSAVFTDYFLSKISLGLKVDVKKKLLCELLAEKASCRNRCIIFLSKSLFDEILHENIDEKSAI